ncbi:MAG: glycerophosphodiester phosphodiesterase family protein [Candidatus Saccharimonadales bacterium]
MVIRANMKVIGHRGVRNIEVENTLSSLKLAASLDVDAIELDIRLTKDRQLVLCHNESLKQVYGIDKNIHDLTLKEARRAKIPTLNDAVELELGKPLVLDIKVKGTAELLHSALVQSGSKNIWSVTSLLPAELLRLKQLYPGLETTLQSNKHPFRDIKIAKKTGSSNINFALYLLNPLTHRLARRAGLKVRTYQNYLSFLLNSPLVIRLLKLFYPELTVYSDRPDKILAAAKS